MLAYFFKKGVKIVKLVRVTGRSAAVSKIFVFGMLREISRVHRVEGAILRRTVLRSIS